MAAFRPLNLYTFVQRQGIVACTVRPLSHWGDVGVSGTVPLVLAALYRSYNGAFNPH